MLVVGLIFDGSCGDQQKSLWTEHVGHQITGRRNL